MSRNNGKQGPTNPKQAKRDWKEVDVDDADEHPVDTDFDIKSMLKALSGKMDTLNNSMSGIDKNLNNKIDNLDAKMLTRINDVKADLDKQLQTTTTAMDQRLVNAMDDVKVRCEQNVSNAMMSMRDCVDEIRAHHESRLDRLERYSLEKDVIISGVPLESNDSPLSVMGDICAALNCNLKQGDFVDVFRLGHTGRNAKNARSVPIVARLQDNWAKQELITAYFRKKNLNLKDIGFRTSNRIYINERLTAINREIFNRAAEAKKSNLIFRFYTRRGLVYVQRLEKDRPACMFSMSDLDVVFPQNYECQRNVRGRRNVPMQGPVVHPTNPTNSVDMANGHQTNTENMDDEHPTNSADMNNEQIDSISPIATDPSPHVNVQNQHTNGSNSPQANE